MKQLGLPASAWLLLVFLSTAPSVTAATTVLEQGWTDRERRQFYHKDQGTALFPYHWFLALEQADLTSEDLFRSDANLSRYRFIPDPDNPVNNEDRLPVGFTKSTGIGGQPSLGFTCAACHTGEIRHTDKSKRQHVLRIDGGPSMQNNLLFVFELYAALRVTVGLDPGDLLDVPNEASSPTLRECYGLRDSGKFIRFAARLPGTPDKEALRKEICNFLKAKTSLPVLAALANGINTIDPINGVTNKLIPTAWGFGRLDAFGRGGNAVFTRLDTANLRIQNAPVSIPPLWGAWQYDWIQWNGSIQNQTARGIAEAIGVGATVLDPAYLADPLKRWDSSVNIDALLELEGYAKKLTPPGWPDVFTPIDTKKAARGKALYGKLCSHCHEPVSLAKPNAFGHRYAMDKGLIPLHVIGTDPNHAFNFYARAVRTGPLQMGLMPAAQATQLITTEIMKSKNMTFPSNEWRAPLAYLAHPLAGVWATAPYLHNGSVPTLYQLLLPAEERDMTFCLRSGEYDEMEVGFKTDCMNGERAFDTGLPANSNAGHEFKNVEDCQKRIAEPKDGVLGCELKDEDRKALVEYLKTF